MSQILSGALSVHRYLALFTGSPTESIFKRREAGGLCPKLSKNAKKVLREFYELRYFHELRSFMSSEQTALCSSNIVIINNQSGAISKDQPNPSCCLFGKLINWASDAGLLSLLLKFHSVVFMLPIANSLHFYALG